MNYAVIRHADGKKSKSKYQGGFKNGKNTSAYNHDYYIHNKEKWQDNQGDFEEEYDDIQNMPDGPEKQAALKKWQQRKDQAERAKKNVTPKGSKEYQEEVEYNSKKNSSNQETKKKTLVIKKSTQTTTKTGNNSDSLMGKKEKEAIINERKQMGKKKKYSIVDRLMGQPEKDNLKRAQENYDRASGMKKQYDANMGYRMQTHTATKGQMDAHNALNTKRRTGEVRAKNKLKEAKKAYDKTLPAKIEKGKAWLDKIFKDGRKK